MNAGWEPSELDAFSGSAGAPKLEPVSTCELDEENTFELLGDNAKRRFALATIVKQGLLAFFDKHELQAANGFKPDTSVEKWMDEVFYALRPVAEMRPLFPPPLTTMTEEELVERVEEAEEARAWTEETGTMEGDAARDIVEAAVEEACELGGFLEEAAKNLAEYMKHSSALICNVNTRHRPLKELRDHDHWYGKAYIEWSLG